MSVPDRSRLVVVLLALATVTVALPPALPAASSPTGSSSSGIDASAATSWVLDAQWTDEGLFTEFPEQVVFPRESARVIDTLDSEDALSRVDAELATSAATSLQLADSGGVLRSAGDTLGPWTGATAHAVRLAQSYPDASTLDEDAAGSFLVGMQNDDGGFGPRLAAFWGSGVLRSSQESTHDAVVALSILDAMNETIREDVLSFVAAEQNSDGGWPAHVNTDTSSVRGTYHALHTLAALGELDAGTANEARDFLYSLEQPSGGFHADADHVPCSGTICQVEPEVTTKSTSRAILALELVDGLDRLNATTRSSHVDWLADRQEDDGRFEGGFETYATTDAPVIDYRENTRLALDTLHVLEADGAVDHEAAVGLLVDTQHEGSGGFAMWPGSLTGTVDTGAATRALAQLDALDAMHEDAMVDTLAAEQRADGSIHNPDWEFESSAHRTAGAVMALARVDRLAAVDADAAAGFLADHQTDEGGFQDLNRSDPDVVTTARATRALEMMGEIDRVDEDSVAEYLAGLQDEDDGYIAERGPHGYPPVRHTSLALRTLDRVSNTSAVDVDNASAFLADKQRADGAYESPGIAAHVVLGLAAVGELDRVDQEATETYLESMQTDRGGLALRVFYAEENAMSRHAIGLEALGVLGADLGGGDQTCPGEDQAADNDGTERRPARCGGG